MDRIFFALLLCAHPAFADADMVQCLYGIYGDLQPKALSCAGSFQDLTFADQNHWGAILFSDNIGPRFVMALDLGFVVQRATPLKVEI